jgi:hypothetical protein
MKEASRLRFWLEAGMAGMAGALLVLTLVTREWIEAVFGVDPDQHNGSFEWLIVAVLFSATLALTASARAEWRKVRAIGV